MQAAAIFPRILTSAAGVLILGWFVWLSLKRAEDPALRAFKWILTLPIIAYLVFSVAPLMDKGGAVAAFVVPCTAFSGIALAILWRKDIASLLARPFENLYTGGNIAPEPKPLYSVAQSLQKRGRYLEAIAEIRGQLMKFPTDFEGHMLLAQIEAEDLHDLPAAEMTIQQLVAQPGHAPKNTVFALYSLADWYLQFGPDRAAAQRALEKVVELLPDTEFSLGAEQRIAHLDIAEQQLSPNAHRKFIVPEAQPRLGLTRERAPMTPSVPIAQPDPAQTAGDLVHHLERHPQDTEARERLAIIYCDHYHRLDLATDQLEQMIEQPNQPSRLVVQWLNKLADLQIREGADYEIVRDTLQRIIDRAPQAAAAETARSRIALLKLEFKAREKKEAVKMGQYEQKLGLKNAVPGYIGKPIRPQNP
jgi:tetratricopeptide (TPR) repeat protein